MDLTGEINRLRKQKNAVILAHNYQLPEIQDIADYVGDSLELARAAVKTDANLIVFSGVNFMAETAKILNPEKKVVMVDRDACCPMADQLRPAMIEDARKAHPSAEVVLYVNTTAECKAHADVCCTSANAADIVNKVKSKEVVFGPDANLAYYVQKRTKKKIFNVPVNGFCRVHKMMTMKDVEAIRKRYKTFVLVVHPECNPDVQEAADYIASTSGMLRVVPEIAAKNIVIGTETGLLHKLRKMYPEKCFVPLKQSAICVNMKKNTLRKVRDALKYERYEVQIPDEILNKARQSIERMIT